MGGCWGEGAVPRAIAKPCEIDNGLSSLVSLSDELTSSRSGLIRLKSGRSVFRT